MEMKPTDRFVPLSDQIRTSVKILFDIFILVKRSSMNNLPRNSVKSYLTVKALLMKTRSYCVTENQSSQMSTC